MNNPPQNVSTRYLTNLLHNGQNAECAIDFANRNASLIEGAVVGWYWTIGVVDLPGRKEQAAGATPIQALQRALEKFNVTFR